LSGRNQPLVCADGVNLSRRNINTVKRNTKALFSTNNEIGLECREDKVYVYVSSSENGTKS
jgi:hypothetical protein